MHGDACMFATLFLGVLDTTTGIVHYINAGHDAPFHVGASGIKGRLTPTGPAVGIAADECYNLQTVTLEPGDLLFCYTDGVTEARSPNGEFFTEKRLLELVNQPVNSTTQILDLVEASVNTHSAGRSPYDDVTMLAVYRTPATGQN
jgi:sigma-B regulation protein RsbU (phosphoserine phosphatase)